MKKLLLTMIVSLAFCGSIFAQVVNPNGYTSHWEDVFYGGDYENQDGIVAFIQIDGNFILPEDNWQDYEVGFFVNINDTEVCRGHDFLADPEEYGDPYPYLNASAVYYTAPGDVVYFKLYNHVTGVEYVDCTTNIEVLTGEGHYEYWDTFEIEDALTLSFTTPEAPEPEIIIWDEPGDWPSGEIPPAGSDVTIPDNSIVVIPNDYTANVGEITMGEGSSIVIEEGGQLYHTEEVEVTMEMDVPEGYNAKNNTTGWRLFACPVTATSLGGDRPIEGTNLNTGTFDLYKFDESVTDNLEWINYKGESFTTDPTDIQFTDLTLMEGYLYANTNQNAGIVMRGYTAPTVSTYVQSTTLSLTSGAEFEGVNLVGNPFTCKAYVSNGNGDMPYYVMNDDGTGFNTTAVAAGTPIYPMKAVLVLATTDGEECMFKTVAAPSSKGTLNITVNQGRSMVDNAILSFGSANTLEKFQFDPNHTKVYMPVEGKNYAVASAPEMGEMPVNFKAESNGTYTLSFNAEEVSFNYLHLIDNMTGADVDVLANPSYTFNAQTTDYANRFKLVYATGNNSNEDSFAFFSNGNFIINNDGEATLQVVDVMGRILSSNTINGCANISVNGAAGVYMLRLINGNDVKVQKVIVK